MAGSHLLLPILLTVRPFLGRRAGKDRSGQRINLKLRHAENFPGPTGCDKVFNHCQERMLSSGFHNPRWWHRLVHSINIDPPVRLPLLGTSVGNGGGSNRFTSPNGTLYQHTSVSQGKRNELSGGGFLWKRALLA